MKQHLTFANLMASIAVFLALGGTSFALSRSERPSLPSGVARVAGACAAGPDVSGPGVNDLNRDAKPVICNRLKKQIARGQYLISATGDWYPETVNGASYPTAGKCMITVDGGRLGGALTSPGNWDGIFDEEHTAAIAIQGIAPLSSGSHEFILKCAQIQGNFRIARSTLTAIRIS